MHLDILLTHWNNNCRTHKLHIYSFFKIQTGPGFLTDTFGKSVRLFLNTSRPRLAPPPSKPSKPLRVRRSDSRWKEAKNTTLNECGAAGQQNFFYAKSPTYTKWLHDCWPTPVDVMPWELLFFCFKLVSWEI